MQVIEVLLPVYNLFPLDYKIESTVLVKVGDLVVVSFRNKLTVGMVWSIKLSTNHNNLKLIESKLDSNLCISQDNILFLKKSSNYYLAELGSVFKLMLPINHYKAFENYQSKEQVTNDKINNIKLPLLSDAQINSLEFINLQSKPVLMQGVTGSGKTEVYFHLIANYISRGMQVVVLLPEIALSSQIISRFEERFGFAPVVWNSSITSTQKKKNLLGILSKDVKIVIGARSSLFLPYPNLGLIIVDEEHDASYKQEDGVLYNARDMAVLRASLRDDIKVVLCSATPSIETLYNVSINKYAITKLENRYAYSLMPDIQIIDMRLQSIEKNKWLSGKLTEAISNTLAKGEQVLLFLNRRGYAPLILCNACGYRFSCSSCSSSLVLHKKLNKLECHYCGYERKIPTTCNQCDADDTLLPYGVGIERIADEVCKIFKNNKIGILSKDIKDIKLILNKVLNNEIDILIGTQIITKGYHFPNLTLIGIVDADLGFIGGDLRSTERNFQLLQQVSGRAGREKDKIGKVYIQTYNPENIVFDTLKYSKVDEFINYELKNRQELLYPPFSKVAVINLSGLDDNKTYILSKKIISIMPLHDNIKIYGPAKPLIDKLAGKYRYKILIIATKKFNIQEYLKHIINLVKLPHKYSIKIDIDPQSFI